MSQPDSNLDSPAESSLGVGFWSALAVVYGLLVAFSLLRVPIPGVNEPHYLCKAKHFWNPSWCSGDLFLSSSNPHLVFYATFGWLTKFLSLNTVAVIVRFACLLPLAVGWHFLVFRLVKNAWASVLAMALFFVLQSAGNWSGEWLVGGGESKVIAYGFLFWSISQAMVLKLPSSALLAGAAISFHPVIGVWGTIAATMATIVFLFFANRVTVRNSIPPLRTWCLATVLFLLAASPGLLSAGQAVLDGDPESTRIATLLQVEYRLGHHLDPLKFPKEAYRYFALLICVWLILLPKNKNPDRDCWWNLIVLASLLIAVSGVAIGWGPRPFKEMVGYEWRISALKFYPFRLADLLVPIAVSIAAANQMLTWLNFKLSHRTSRVMVLLTTAFLMTWAGLSIPASEQNPSRMSVEKRQNWIAACHWIQEETPTESLVFSFGNKWAVKWYCERAEYVNYKDCPQDAKSIIGWNQRRWVISRWKKNAFKDGRVSSEELRELSENTGVTIFICDRLGLDDQTPDYENKDFRVYRVELLTKPRIE